MAGLKSSTVVVLALTLVSIQLLQSSVAQTTHIVGDSSGWTIPSANGLYTTWAARQTFAVGDSLLFNFSTGQHNVAEVSQAAYGPCTATNPISITTTGPATLTLSTAGTHYYICTVGAHCQLGQKLAINVSAGASTSPAPAPAPATPPPTPAPVSPPSTTPAPAPSTTTPPPTSAPAPSPTTSSPPAPPPASPAPGSTATPAPGSTATPPGSSTTPPPPPPGNSASSFTAVVPVTFLVIALALFH